MTVTITNLIQGPGTLYTGAFGATEPADSAVNAVPAASAWTDLGATDGGVKLSVDQTYSELAVDQLVDSPGRRLTKREFMLDTNLAEPTLTNLSTALNGGTSASGTGWLSYEPLTTTSATQPNYIAAIMDGYAPQSFRRRVIGRRMLNTSKVESSYTKDKQTFIPVSFAGHYVSSVIAPFHVADQTA